MYKYVCTVCIMLFYHRVGTDMLNIHRSSAVASSKIKKWCSEGAMLIHGLYILESVPLCVCDGIQIKSTTKYSFVCHWFIGQWRTAYRCFLVDVVWMFWYHTGTTTIKITHSSFFYVYINSWLYKDTNSTIHLTVTRSKILNASHISLCTKKNVYQDFK